MSYIKYIAIFQKFLALQIRVHSLFHYSMNVILNILVLIVKLSAFCFAQIYYDGQAVPGCCDSLTNNIDQTLGGCTTPAQPQLGLGAKYPDGTGGEPNTYGSVTLDEIRVWDHFWLTEQEIMQVYLEDL